MIENEPFEKLGITGEPIEQGSQEESEEEKQKRGKWEALEKDLKVLSHSVFEKARLALGDEWAMWIMDKKVKFATKLKKNYPKEFDKYVAFHVLASSTTEYDKSPGLDFPEPDSVESFLKECEEELDEILDKTDKK
jgi:hypothetical protein